MPVLIAICAAVVTTLLTNIISRIVGAIGFGMVSYAGANALLSGFKSLISSYVGGLPSAIFALLGMAGFGQAISILFSALVIRMTLAGMDAAGSMIQSKWGGFKSQ
ncbi:DUF2523 domain-containing protein [Chromobacterium sp. IIBBL 290-4]|uniref:DUF2523 domain-containing protein n=1 Tax=Chromobacterium sp. IIBBL 290-4 TaxID=2953890 RepID=UPI0020B6CD42|nr:DUF2523 domain-containing protein [Chromobacterium sp. IIBBL 290-4]UTH73573.1 DUF2523 domain-containing protein [Chromobacterium sp. IIBBL 290-4]